jgi:hypothetical protein
VFPCKKIPTIRQSLVGGMLTPHDCFVVRQALHNIDYLHAQMAQLDEQIAESLKPYQVQYELLQSSAVTSTSARLSRRSPGGSSVAGRCSSDPRKACS